MTAHEVNFDGLVGPTHNYAGLARGNLASTRNKGRASNPRKAALEGLAKMKFLADLGVKQAVLPPHDRPDLATLRRLGFSGSDRRVLEMAAKQSPHLLAACCSASAMWTANAATVSPSADTRDGRVHFTPANLIWQFHRSLETQTTARVLMRIFPDPAFFTHHPPLPPAWTLADEGAANQMRLCADHGEPGVEVLIFGRDGLAGAVREPRKFPARQTLQASQAVARRHGLTDVVLARQSRLAIDAGAFHNDVVAVSNLNVLLYHEGAWADGPAVLRRLRASLRSRGAELAAIKVKAREVSLADAVESYLFNSQLVTLPDGAMALIAPLECRRISSAQRFLDALPGAGTPIAAVHFVPVRQSMRNGGGPACLRLRVVLTEREFKAAHQGVFLTPALHAKLTAWVNRHHRDRLTPRELADPRLHQESRRALDELTGLLKLGSIYDFQRD